MNPAVAQLQALAMQIECLRAQVDAVLSTVLAQQPTSAPPLDPAETCPTCGATGETQTDTSRVDGSKRITCAQCRVERVLS